MVPLQQVPPLLRRLPLQGQGLRQLLLLRQQGDLRQVILQQGGLLLVVLLRGVLLGACLEVHAADERLGLGDVRLGLADPLNLGI